MLSTSTELAATDVRDDTRGACGGRGGVGRGVDAREGGWSVLSDAVRGREGGGSRGVWGGEVYGVSATPIEREEEEEDVPNVVPDMGFGWGGWVGVGVGVGVGWGRGGNER